MASLRFLSFIALATFINAGSCQGVNVDQSDDVYSGLTDRELILSLVKRIDQLENWNRNQQSDINSLHATVRQQKRKLAVLESVIEQHSKEAESSEDINQTTGGVPEPSKETGSDSQHMAMMNHPGKTVNKRFQGHRISMRQVGENPRVAFYATASRHMIDLGGHQVLEFENVTTNVGAAYNANTGIFTAPYDGIYGFSVTLLAHNGANGAASYVAKNGAWISYIYTRGSESPSMTSSHSLVLQLSSKDDVEIRSATIGTDIHGDNYSSFGGFLLYHTGDSEVIVG